MQSIKSILFYLLFFTGLTQQSLAQNETVLSVLESRFTVEVKGARASLADPQRPTGHERFLLAFSLWRYNRRERIGRILVSLREQTKIAQRYSEKTDGYEFESAHSNQLLVDAAMQALKTRIKMTCAQCESIADWNSYRKTVDAYFDVFNITDSHSGFSGLPFTKLMESRFFDQTFQGQVIHLHARLENLLEKITHQPGVGLNTTIFDEALIVTGGDKTKAVELLGLLTSRDVLITRYFRYMKSPSADFMQAFARVPALTRLLVELDRQAHNDKVDRFSYDGRFTTTDDRSYYYWSAALAAQRLKLAGFESRFISLVSLEFARQYKTIRFFEEKGFLKGENWRKNFLNNSVAAFLTTAKGARAGINSIDSTKEPGDAVEAYLQALKPGQDSEDNIKKDWIRNTLEKGLPEGRAAILYYDFSSSKAGLSHMKIAIGDQIYEIHRFKNENQSFLRERPALEALLDSAPGVLPSGILEFEITTETKNLVLSNLRDLSDATMQYSFFNKALNGEAFNCAGVIYEALRLSKIPLPNLAIYDAFPAQIFEKMTKAIPHARLWGKHGGVKDLFVKPNIEVATFKGNRAGKNNWFKDQVGKAWLNAEQILSTQVPMLSNLRNVLGLVVPSYKTTGSLPQEFTPGAAQTFALKTFLLPESEAGLISYGDSGFENLREHLFVEINGKKYVRIFTHPLEFEKFREIERKSIPDPIQWLATPSSSSRSLFVQDSQRRWPVFGIKASLSIEMGGAGRIIDSEKAVRAVGISKIFSMILKEHGKVLPSGKTWSFMAEPYSVLPSEISGGFILRELPPNIENKIFIPIYALVAKRDNNEMWIEELFRYSGRSSKLEFIEKDFVKPLVELHNLISLENGLTTELHQQNVLIQINQQTKRIEGFVVRDMDSHWIDYSLRKNYLRKEVPEGQLKAQAYTFRYGMAQENQLKSYVEILRTRSFEWILKYFLDAKDLAAVLKAADQTYIAKFNKVFAFNTVRSLAELSKAWDKIHLEVTSAEEKAVYKDIAVVNEAQKNNLVLEGVRWLQEKIAAKKIQKSVGFGMCSRVFQ